jgi:hypothetical protein
MDSKIPDTVRSLPHPLPKTGDGPPDIRRTSLRRTDREMRAVDAMVALEEKLRHYEEELLRLRVENEQLRRSSQAFGELAERLSIALRTATRVDRRSSTAADSGRRRARAES